MPNDSRSIAGAIADLRRRMADQDRLEEQLAAASATPTANTIVKSGTASTTIDAGWIPLLGTAQIPTLGTAQIPILDHGINLTGLADDDHTQYLLASGTRALTGNWEAGQTRNVTVGTIGIGTTTPAYPLHVIGTARADTVFASTVTATAISGTTLSGTSVTGSTVSATTLQVNGYGLTVGTTSYIGGSAVVTTGDQTIGGVKTFSGTAAAALLTGTVNATVLQQGGNPLSVGGTSSITGTAVVTTGDQTIAGVKTFTGQVNATTLRQNGTALGMLNGGNTWYGGQLYYGQIDVGTGGNITVNTGAEIVISTGGSLKWNTYPLTVAGPSSLNGTVTGHMSGGGTVATGGFGLTVPATGTAVLNTSNQTVAGNKTFSGNTTFSGPLIISSEAITLTSSTATSFAVTQSHVNITNNSGAILNISEITGGSNGMLLILRRVSAGSSIVFVDAGVTTSDALNLSGNFSLSANADTLTLMYASGINRWIEIARSDNN